MRISDSLISTVQIVSITLTTVIALVALTSEMSHPNGGKKQKNQLSWWKRLTRPGKVCFALAVLAGILGASLEVMKMSQAEATKREQQALTGKLMNEFDRARNPLTLARMKLAFKFRVIPEPDRQGIRIGTFQIDVRSLLKNLGASDADTTGQVIFFPKNSTADNMDGSLICHFDLANEPLVVTQSPFGGIAFADTKDDITLFIDFKSDRVANFKDLRGYRCRFVGLSSLISNVESVHFSSNTGSIIEVKFEPDGTIGATPSGQKYLDAETVEVTTF